MSHPDTSRHREWLAALAVAVLALAVYVPTLLPGVGYSGDTAKWQFLGEVGGVPHATGYPLYLAIDQAWVAIMPWGSVAWRVNLLSAVFGAAALAVLYLLLRILDVRPAVAAAGALMFGVGRTFWSQAVVAEVYTLHILLLVTVTACLGHWRRGAANGWLLAGLGVYALSFGHHLTTSLALPGIAWIVLSDRRRALTWLNLAFTAVALVLAAGQYLYLMWLSDVGRYHERNIDTFGDVLTYVTGGDFKQAMFSFSWYELLVGRIPLVLDLLSQELSLLLVPAAVGMYLGVRSSSPAQRAVIVHLSGLAGGTFIYAINYDVPDVVVFCLPLFLSLGVFVSLGLDGATAWVEDRLTGACLVPAGFIMLVTTIGVLNFDEADQSGNVADAERMERALVAVSPSAVLVTEDYHDSEYLWVSPRRGRG